LKHSSIHGGFVAGNPVANIFVIIVGILAISVSIVLGFFAFVVLGSIILIMAAIIGIRVWWFNRQLRGQRQRGASGRQHPSGGVIEGEYRVVADERRDE
jgi:predicted lipid-binding transport protein (Tim44 family)